MRELTSQQMTWNQFDVNFIEAKKRMLFPPADISRFIIDFGRIQYWDRISLRYQSFPRLNCNCELTQINNFAVLHVIHRQLMISNTSSDMHTTNKTKQSTTMEQCQLVKHATTTHQRHNKRWQPLATALELELNVFLFIFSFVAFIFHLRWWDERQNGKMAFIHSSSSREKHNSRDVHRRTIERKCETIFVFVVFVDGLNLLNFLA